MARMTVNDWLRKWKWKQDYKPDSFLYLQNTIVFVSENTDFLKLVSVK